MKTKLGAIILLGASLSGCASRSEHVSASYVSPMKFAAYDCDQLRLSYDRVTTRAVTVAGAQDDIATNDAIALGVATFITWPAVFFMETSDRSDELARLKGAAEAIEMAAVEKRCGLAEDIRLAREAHTTVISSNAATIGAEEN